MVNNKHLSNLLILLLVFSFITLFSYFVFAIHVTSPNLLNSNTAANQLYNITVNNTNPSPDGNITQINITLPVGFIFITDSNGGNGTFTNASTTSLSWTNTTFYLINASINKSYFWFNATNPTTPGVYNITITSANGTANYQTNLTVVVNDSIAPNPLTFIDPTLAANSNVSQTTITVNMSSTDNGGLNTFHFYLWNLTAATYNPFNSTNISATPFGATTAYAWVTFTVPRDGIYFVNATVNDTGTPNNLNLTSELRRFVLDTNYPNATLISPANGDTVNTGSVVFNSTANDTFNNKAPTGLASVYYNITNQSGQVAYLLATKTSVIYYNYTLNTTSPVLYADGQYNITEYAIDYAGNTNSSQIAQITIDNIGPVITLYSPANSTNSTTTDYNFTFNVTGPVAMSNCSLVLDSSTVQVITSVSRVNRNGMSNSSTDIGTHIWSVNCTDTLNRASNSSTFSFVVESASSSNPGSGTGSSTFAYWTLTQAVTPAQFTAGYTQSLAQQQRLKITVSNADHYVGVIGLTSTQATINISSTPQQAVFNIGDTKKFDVTDDNFYDLSVKLNSIANSKANITVKSIHEEFTVTPASNQTGTGNQGGLTGKLTNTTIWIIIIIVVIILVVILLIYFIMKRKK